ncbi:outer membrane lipoprotein carrier protein LolA [Vibrio sp. WXL210]|uniref:outer membrane lipoprotein carrier protein LolA n=1 Tax=Vibrio sp. WXL210 TaxID=3450709 RepID=UPI003EC5C7B9
MLRIKAIFTLMIACILSIGAIAGEHKGTPTSLAEVVDLLSHHRTQAGEFSQAKTISGLSQALNSSGLYFIDADLGIVWSQVRPFEDLLVVKDERLFSRQGDKLVAQDVPANVVALLTDIFAGLMSGNIGNLERQFRLEFSKGQSENEWMVSLKPLSAPLDQVFELITLSGQGGQLSQVELAELSGDHTAISLTPLADAQTSSIDHWLRGQD